MGEPADAADSAGSASSSGAGSPDASPLLVWALATVHAALLVVLFVGVAYGTGAAGELLAGLDTSIGVIAYLYLWGVTWWTNRALLEGMEGDLVDGRSKPSEVLAGALKWGALSGVLVFLPLLLVATVLFLGAGGLESVPFLAIGGVFGVLLAASVGVAVGVALAILDLLLLWASRAWLPTETGAARDPGARTTD